MGTNNSKIEEIERIIGYTFKHKELLISALSHPSYTYGRDRSYQNLEFLGDSILDFLVAEYLLKIYPKSNEGELTKLRSFAVAKDPLADTIDEMGLDEYILIAPNTNPSRKIKSDVFEAIVAAIYYDSGLAKSRKFIIKFLGKQIKLRKSNPDYKSRLLELAVKKNLSVDFILNEENGPHHYPMFSYVVLVGGEIMGKGESHSKKAAQQEAAKEAISKLTQV